MRTYDMRVTVTYHLHGVEAEDYTEAEEYGYYHFDEYPYHCEVDSVDVFDVTDEDEDND